MRDYLPALTGLRFLLALWVILHHIAGRGMMLETWTKSLPTAGQSLIFGGLGFMPFGTCFFYDLPDSVAGMSVDRQCASGLMAIALS